MTTTKTTTAKKASDAANTVKNETVETVEVAAANVTDGAREFVKRTAATAKERSDDAYENVAKYNSGLEKTLNRFVVGYVGVLSEVAEAAHQNVTHALSTVEKIAAAKSVSEAAQIQVDFVRENATANFDRVRNAASAARDVASEGVSSLRDAMPYGKKAA